MSHTLIVPRETTVLLLLLALSASACAAENVNVRYPGPAEAPSGKVIVELSRPVGLVKVVINGNLVGQGEWTEHIEVDRVPTGKVTVAVAGGDGTTKPMAASFEVDVSPGGEYTVLVAAPEVTDGMWTYLGLEYLGISVMYAAVLFTLL